VPFGPFDFWNNYTLGATRPTYFVRRFTVSPPCVSYWTRSTPVKAPGLAPLPPNCAAKTCNRVQTHGRQSLTLMSQRNLDAVCEACERNFKMWMISRQVIENFPASGDDRILQLGDGVVR
jgi:hypothetical protein